MAILGKYEQSHVVVKIIQWLGCIFLLSIPAMLSIYFFPQPLSVTSLKWIQLIQISAMFLFPPLCMAYLWSKQPLEWLKLKTESGMVEAENGKLKTSVYLLVVGIMLVALPGINLLSYLNQQMELPTFLESLEQWMKTKEEIAGSVTDSFLAADSIVVLIINLLLMAVLPAVAEELTFRGVLQGLLGRTKVSEFQSFKVSGFQDTKVPHAAIWVTAILFSAIHMQFYGFVPRMLMGALFGYALAWTGSLWIPILMHLTNNAMAVLMYYVATRSGWDMDKLDAIGTNDTLWLGVVSIVITIIGIYAFRRSTTMSKASSRISSGN